MGSRWRRVGSWCPSQKGEFGHRDRHTQGEAHENMKAEIGEMLPQAKGQRTLQTTGSWRGAWDRLSITASDGTNLTATTSTFQPPDRETTHFCCLCCSVRTDLAKLIQVSSRKGRIIFPWVSGVMAGKEGTCEFEQLRAGRAVCSRGLSV